MKTIKLDIEDSKVGIVLNILENLKSDVISKLEIINKNNKNDYCVSKEYSENKTYFQKSLKDIENRNSELVPFDEGLDDIDNYIENL